MDQKINRLKELMKGKDVKITNLSIQKVYQDTDSNYFTTSNLQKGIVKDRYLENDQYIKTTIFGLYNNLFCEFIEKVMNKFPLKFAFEGAFYSAWYITKKNYLGQKIPNETCYLDSETDDLKIFPGVHVQKHIQLQEYSGQNIGNYLADNHIKVTGLKLIKRNTIMLAKKNYLKMIEMVLNEKELDAKQMLKLALDIKNHIKQYNIEEFLEKKKCSQAFVESQRGLAAKYQFGLGDNVFLYYILPQKILNQFRFISGIKKSDSLGVYKVNDRIIQQDPDQKIYYGTYLFNMVKNILKFQNNFVTDKEVKDFIKNNNLFPLGMPTKFIMKNYTTKELQEIIQNLDKRHVTKREINGMLVDKDLILNEIEKRK